MEYEKILFSRLLFSFLWTLALNIFPLWFYILVTNFDIVHPDNWLGSSLLLVFNIGTWISLIPLYGLLFAIGYILSQELKKPPPFSTSRFQLLCSLFSRNNILKWFLYTLLGITVPCTYLKLNNFSLTQQCQEFPGRLCLDERSVFLVTCGVWTAIYYFIRFDFLTEKYLQFPIIRQVRFLQIRSKFPTTFWNSLQLSFLPVFYFLPFYLWYGETVNSIFEFILSVSLENSTLTRISGLLDISLLINAWLISSVYFSLIDILRLMIQIHYTEHYSFPLMKQSNSTSVLLSTALGEENIPIIQHLACYDLFIMSMSQKSERWQIFTLSQPGGHPHTWNAILHESLKLIDKFILEINQIYEIPKSEEPPPPIPRHIHIRTTSHSPQELTSKRAPISPTSKLRNLVEQPERLPVQQEETESELWTKIDPYVKIIQQNTIVNYIFGSKPDAMVRYLVSNSQPLIWVIQSMSELAANALTEDQFGIVLKDLPLIINTLLRLKFSLDKLGNIQKKFQKRDHDLCMKASLKSAVRRSLYRIAIAYSDYLTDLPLPPENLDCMNSFVNFRES